MCTCMRSSEAQSLSTSRIICVPYKKINEFFLHLCFFTKFTRYHFITFSRPMIFPQLYAVFFTIFQSLKYSIFTIQNITRAELQVKRDGPHISSTPSLRNPLLLQLSALLVSLIIAGTFFVGTAPHMESVTQGAPTSFACRKFRQCWPISQDRLPQWSRTFSCRPGATLKRMIFISFSAAALRFAPPWYIKTDYNRGIQLYSCSYSLDTFYASSSCHHTKHLHFPLVYLESKE
jgi:hypothetical protein